MKRSKVLCPALFLSAACGLLGGCAGAGAQFCRQDPLDHPEIRFDDAAHREILDDHVYFSKEGSTGGRGSGGGGCGCN